MRVGELVIVTHPFLGCPADSIAMVYEIYDGVSLLVLEDGTDLGGFSYDEMKKYLIKTNIVLQPYTDYKFKSVMKLSDDYRNGYFDGAIGVVKNLGKMLIRDCKLRNIGIE